MSAKKIGYYDARRISENVANKAFEHLLSPMQVECDKLAQEAYDAVRIYLGLSYANTKCMEDAEVISMCRLCGIHIVTGKDEDGDLIKEKVAVLGSDDYDAPNSYVCSRMTIPEDLADGLHEMWEKMGPIVEAKQQLGVRINCDIQGKTPTSVIKKWPELRGFIEDVMGVQGTGELVVPFSDVLQKYLGQFVALPAPEAT